MNFYGGSWSTSSTTGTYSGTTTGGTGPWYYAPSESRHSIRLDLPSELYERLGASGYDGEVLKSDLLALQQDSDIEVRRQAVKIRNRYEQYMNERYDISLE